MSGAPNNPPDEIVFPLDSDDDDMDFEPAESSESEYHDLESEDRDLEDAVGSDDGANGEQEGSEDASETEDPLNSVEIELEVDEADGEAAEDSNAPAGRVRVTQIGGGGGNPMQISRAQILRLLSSANVRQVLTGGGARSAAAPDDSDSDDNFGWTRRRRRKRRDPAVELPPIPNPAGRALMASGTFGSQDYYEDRLRKRQKRLARRVMLRELGINGITPVQQNALIAQDLIPTTKPETIIDYDSRCYSGQFSEDGNFFFSCSQDFYVRMYDTSNPYDWKYYKAVLYPYGSWTITDATLSPDNKYLAYSSIRSVVNLAATDPDDQSEPFMLDFANMHGRRGGRGHGGTHFGIWSVRFSGDGRELVAGTSNASVYVFDVEANQSILRIPGHHEDVNAVCFGDKTSPHILYSGSDDTLIKVWDRRSMSDSREAGVFIGHTEGITYVDSKGDGRYVLSNSKDQSMKLWDLRKMMSTGHAAARDWQRYTTGFDYRYEICSPDEFTPHPHDCSIVTFRGHSVLKTLIRCHFSPPNSTDSRYVYTGSEDGKVHIYNLDASLVAKIDVAAATAESQSQGLGVTEFDDEWQSDSGRAGWRTCVRDASWHPNAPMIAATSWNGRGLASGTCTVHAWDEGKAADETQMRRSRRVNEKLESRARLPEDLSDDGLGMPTRRHSTRASVRERMRRRLRNVLA